MSLVAHVVILGLVLLDLLIGSPAVSHLAGRWAGIGFEFAVVLGYILFILPSWRGRGEE